MSLENIHKTIQEKLLFFRVNKQIPNIIFHGPNGSGKYTLVQNFINDIYNNDKELIRSYVMNVNCAHGKGIKFIRDDLKFFAKTHINIKGTGHFKTIVLSNAGKLTIDAQSAMRRCIELFSHTTRFFIIVDDKYKLLKPILSRFCEIYVSHPIIDNKKINLHQYSLDNCFPKDNIKYNDDFKSKIEKTNIKSMTYDELMVLTYNLYECGYSGIDLIQYIEHHDEIEPLKKSHYLITFHKIKGEFMNEKLFMLFILTFIRSDDNLENISFM